MPLSIAIASGKGGVGKTSIAINIALALQSSGWRTCLLDTDFGVANAHILLGIDPEFSIGDFLEGEKSFDALCSKGPLGVQFISGGSANVNILNLDTATRFNIIRATESLVGKMDALVVDVPAGASDATLDFVSAADNQVVVLVGEPTSFMDAYSLIKAAHLEKQVNHFHIVVNMANSEAEAHDHFNRFRNITARFLDVQLTLAGFLPFSNSLRRSVIDRKPTFLANHKSRESLAIQTIATSLMKRGDHSPEGIRFFGVDNDDGGS